MTNFLSSPAFWICLILAASDAMRDKLNLAAYKWPNSGVRIMRRGLTLKITKTKAGNAQAELVGFRLVVTVDLWHCVKWVNLYVAGAFVWLHVPTWQGKAVAVAAAWLLWRVIPKPNHWK